MARDERHVYLLRHGETEWSRSGKHTSVTDVPLTGKWSRGGAASSARFSKRTFRHCSYQPAPTRPRTCDLAGLGNLAAVEADLTEWNYGECEGLTSAEIRLQRPDWSLFRDGCPEGESPEQVALRADRVIAKVRQIEGDVALFAHGHILRVLAARWINLPVGCAERFLLDTASLSVLGYYYDSPAVKIWNAPVAG